MRQRRWSSQWVVGGLALGLVALAAMGSASASPQRSRASVARQIAASTLGHDLRVGLHAVRGTAGGATVYVSASEFSGGAWKPLGRVRVGARNSWLWPVVTGIGAICQLSTSDVDPYPIEVRLLVSSSIGCSPATYNFHVDKYDELVAG